MIKHYFNDNLTNKGVEGFWYKRNGKLIFFIEATNSREDWFSNFKAFPVLGGSDVGFIHAGYANYANWVMLFIWTLILENDIEKTSIFGYSMGGGIAQIVGVYIPEANIISIDGPRTTSKVNDNMKLYYNRGSLVHNIPFWFKRIKNRIVLNKKWHPFWKSHGDYDLDKIIEDNT